MVSRTLLPSSQILVPAPCSSGLCIPVLTSLHPSSQSFHLTPCSLDPCIPGPCILHPLPPPPFCASEEMQSLPGGLRVVHQGKKLSGCLQRLPHLQRAGGMQGDPYSPQLWREGGTGRKRLDSPGQSSCVKMLPSGSCSRRGRLWG